MPAATRLAPYAIILFACTSVVSIAAEGPTAKPTWTTVVSQPANIGDAAIAALAYHASGAYAAGLAQVADAAVTWVKERASKVAKPALVLDIDETALSNWSIIERDDFGRPIAGGCELALDAPCGWAAWDQLGHDPPIEPTLQLFRAARRAGVSVFFITGRPEAQRAATVRNLAAAGYGDYAELAMVPAGKTFASAADFKTPVRTRIEADGYKIIANHQISSAGTRNVPSCCPTHSIECREAELTQHCQGASIFRGRTMVWVLEHFPIT